MLLQYPTYLCLLALAATSTARTACLDDISHDTIAFFSGAALTFGFNYTDAADCGLKCSTIAACQTWLFTSGGQCELFRQSPVATAPNPNFSYGVCGRGSSSSVNLSSSSVHSSSHLTSRPTPSSLLASMTPDSAAIKRHWDAHKHANHHHHHHHHRHHLGH